MGEGTSLSARIRVAVTRARWVARVRREGEPGPEPARMMRGGRLWWRVRRSRVEMERGGVVEVEVVVVVVDGVGEGVV